MRNKQILKNILLAIITVIISLAIVEVFLHFFYPCGYLRPPHKSIWTKLIHRPSQIPGLDYELVPNSEKYYSERGTMIKVNSFGMRDEEPQSKDNSSLFRIAVLGDSFTFGYSVEAKNAYPKVLEQLLNSNEEVFDKKVDVLNYGVGGYSTRDESLVFKYKATDLDLVIIGYYFNDPEIDPIQPLQTYFSKISWWQYSNLFRRIAKCEFLWKINKYGDGDYFKYLHRKNRRKWQSVVDSLKEIKSIADGRKIPVLLVMFPITKNQSWADYQYLDLHQQVADTAKKTGIYVLDLYKEFSQYPGKSLMVSPEKDDNHPSKLAHDIAAHAIYQFLLDNKEQIIAYRLEKSE